MQSITTMHLEALKSLKQKKEFELSILRRSDVYTDRTYHQIDILRYDIQDIEVELTKRKLSLIHNEEIILHYLSDELKVHKVPQTVIESISRNVVFKSNKAPTQIVNGSYVPRMKRKRTFKRKVIETVINLVSRW